MPESKKLSELIEDFVWKTMEFNQYANFRNNVPQSILGKMTDKIDYLKNQIDQKFEELRCECNKEEKEILVKNGNSFEELFTKTYIIPPETKNKNGESTIRTFSTNCEENCCLKKGIEFTYYDGKLVSIGCLEHKYAPHTSENP